VNNRGVWALAAVAALALLVAGISQVPAQRPNIGGGGAGIMIGPPGPMPGRFVVARVAGESIILLDTATGELYRADSKDVKAFSEKPKVEAPPRFFPGRERPRDGDGPRDRPREERKKEDRKRDAPDK